MLLQLRDAEIEAHPDFFSLQNHCNRLDLPSSLLFTDDPVYKCPSPLAILSLSFSPYFRFLPSLRVCTCTIKLVSLLPFSLPLPSCRKPGINIP